MFSPLFIPSFDSKKKVLYVNFRLQQTSVLANCDDFFITFTSTLPLLSLLKVQTLHIYSYLRPQELGY